MNLADILTNSGKLIKANAPEILTAIGVSGVITTSYLSGKASYEAAQAIAREQYRLDQYEKSHPLDLKEKVKHVWKLYIPALISGGATVGCIIGASRANGKRTAAAVAAYSITERAFSEYKDKVVEQIGKNKEQQIRDEIAQDKVTKSFDECDRQVIISGTGHMLCCELATGRYFRSDMETLRKAQNDINAKIVHQFYVTLDDFYDIIGLAHTSDSDKHGWDSDKLMALQFSTALAPDNEPCITFEYNYTKPLR